MESVLVVLFCAGLASILFIKNDGETESPMRRIWRRVTDPVGCKIARMKNEMAAPSPEEAAIDLLAQAQLIHPADYVAGRIELRHRRRQYRLYVVIALLLAGILTALVWPSDPPRTGPRYETVLQDGQTYIIDHQTGAVWRRTRWGKDIVVSPPYQPAPQPLTRP